MLNNLSEFARRYASGRNVLIFFALQMIISILILPYMQSKFDPQGTLGVLDLKFGFTADEAYNMLQAYGEEGRKYYLFAESVIDIIYPIIYTITNVLLLSYVFKKAFSPVNFIQKLNIFPILACIGDLLENTGIIKMITAFPEKLDVAASFASNAGLFKWVTFGISGALLVIGLIGWIMTVLKKKS